MSYFVKKSWIALMMVAAAFSVAYVCDCKRPADKTKPKQIVLDRLVNELVCQSGANSIFGPPKIDSISNPPRLGMSVDGHDFFAALGDKYYCKIRNFGQ